MSVVIDFLPLTKRWRKPIIFPETYAKLLSEIYSQFESVSVATFETKETDLEPMKTNLDLNINYEKNSALIIVRDVGSTFEASCNRMLRNIEELNMTSVYFDLPLNQSRTNSAIQWLKERKFILAGLMPLFHKETDYIRMQRIMAEVDFDIIETHTEIAGKLKETIKNEYNAIREKGSTTYGSTHG